MSVLGTALAIGAVTAAVKGAGHGAARLSKGGRAMAAQEKAARERLQTPGAYGLSGAQKRSMVSDVTQAQRGGEGGLTAQAEANERTARAQGPFGGGRATQALGQLGQAEAAGTAKAGGQVAALSSQVAQQQKATDTATIANALARRTAALQDVLGSAAQAGTTAYGQALQAETAEGLKQRAGDIGGLES